MFSLSESQVKTLPQNIWRLDFLAILLITVILVFHLLIVSFTAVSNSLSFWASWVLNSLINCFKVELCFNSMSSCSHLYKNGRKYNEEIKYLKRVWEQFSKVRDLGISPKLFWNGIVLSYTNSVGFREAFWSPLMEFTWKAQVFHLKNNPE